MRKTSLAGSLIEAKLSLEALGLQIVQSYRLGCLRCDAIALRIHIPKGVRLPNL